MNVGQKETREQMDSNVVIAALVLDHVWQTPANERQRVYS